MLTNTCIYLVHLVVLGLSHFLFPCLFVCLFFGAVVLPFFILDYMTVYDVVVEISGCALFFSLSLSLSLFYNYIHFASFCTRIVPKFSAGDYALLLSLI